MSIREGNAPCKSYETIGAEILFSEESWETIKLSSHEKILKPKFMVSNIDWRNLSLVKDARAPFMRVVYSNDSIVYIEASSGVVREVPIFYTVQNKKLILSDCPRKLINSNLTFNDLSLNEFLAFGYVTSDRTLFDGIYSLEAGNTLIFSKDGVRVETNYLYNSYPILDMPYQELLNRLQSETETVFNDLIKAIKGKHVIIPLSAGYDSRFIASMLKIGGFENVTCFAWGKPGNKDIEISRAVAHKLGYKWEAVDYSEQQWRDALDTEWIRPLLVKSSNYVSISGAASIPFQKLLRDRDIQNNVLLPGHTGDFIGGGHIPKALTRYSAQSDIEFFIKEQKLISRSQKSDDQISFELKKQIAKYASYTDSYRIFEAWDHRERQCKFAANTNRYYEALGIGWSMPFWDFRFVKFWDQVPLDLKKGEKLYHDFLENYIFRQVGVDLWKKKKLKNLLLKNRYYL
jgi:asparagine synthase (glutamine-hydrolysing)